MRHVGDHQSQLLQKGEPVRRLCNGTVMPALGFGLPDGPVGGCLSHHLRLLSEFTSLPDLAATAIWPITLEH
jgi:hypothetical protein